MPRRTPPKRPMIVTLAHPDLFMRKQNDATYVVFRAIPDDPLSVSVTFVRIGLVSERSFPRRGRWWVGLHDEHPDVELCRESTRSAAAYAVLNEDEFMRPFKAKLAARQAASVAPASDVTASP